MRAFTTGSLALFFALTLAACGPNDPEGFVPPEESESELSDLAAIFDGAPPNASLPDDNKADAVYPKKFDLADKQSAVKSQGRRGTCTIFATTALMEHLYIAAGQPAEETDFSEQYLQWSVKTQVGSFPNTAGSNARSNLEAINRFGIPAEGFWPYESSQWGSSNDPECTGDSMPTKCYTNGEPPASATAEQLYNLPRGRWLNTNSIKAHMTGKNEAVVVGVEFFYQAWNHGAGSLPSNRDYWKAGYVTTPNAKDIEVSREKPAGHGILLLGWDDDLTVPKRDGAGELVTDADGNPELDKGFFLFKNSWGTNSFGIENEFGAGYGWISMEYIEGYATAYVSGLPDIAPPVEICGDGEDNDGNGQTDCDDAACASTTQCSTPPVTDTLSFSSDPAVAIPDNDATGVSDTITVSDTGTVQSVSALVMITHPYQGDLKVTLSHGGKEVVLHDRTGGGADDLLQTYTVGDFAGMAVDGPWTLTASDGAARDTGSLESWELEIIRSQP
ncbi:MAG: proprotein convertase P-domain-containing protein [Deltaproteobacteria bacterium]|nr:proprotein convertase P-domain-containing protein [Deltaproteobacteria bacterium]